MSITNMSSKNVRIQDVRTENKNILEIKILNVGYDKNMMKILFRI